jgi:hypothetical protein
MEIPSRNPHEVQRGRDKNMKTRNNPRYANSPNLKRENIKKLPSAHDGLI